MKINKSFLMTALSLLAISTLVGCGGKSNSSNSSQPQEEEEKPLEIGDTVKEWTKVDDSEDLPFDIPSGTGTRKIVDNFGAYDEYSLHFEVKSSANYLTTEIEEPYFKEFDAKNGDIISLYVYIPSNSNLTSLELELRSITIGGGYGSNGTAETIKGTKLEVNADKENKWIRLEGSYDTLYNLGAIRLNYVPVDNDENVEFYVDDINITLGEETVETKYEYKDESLCETYKDHFIVGTALSNDMVRNSEYRRITKHNFNSVTAENEAKPERVLNQAACQELAKTDETAVAIDITPFEKIYDWCEASHIKVRHHTFVWHQQTPGWFFNKGYQSSGQQVTREVMLARLDNYLETMIETLDERWPGLVYALDIVNEAIEEVGRIRTSGNWKNVVGDDFIYQAFLAASRHKKDYQDLYYNDYAFDQIEWGGIDRCHWACDELLKQAIDDGLIDGIGIQGHLDKPEYADAIIEDAQIIHAAGIKCQITELDIACNNKDFDDQKNLYRKVVGSILEGNENGLMDVNAIIVWGISDNLSWHSNTSPLMFNSDYSKKPAYYGFLDALEAFESGDTFLDTSAQ